MPDTTYYAHEEKPFRLGEVESQRLGESDWGSEKVSSATDINYKNTCLRVFRKLTINDLLVIQLSTILQDFFAVSSSPIRFSEMKSRAYLPRRARRGSERKWLLKFRARIL
jgi:hypothetical protein